MLLLLGAMGPEGLPGALQTEVSRELAWNTAKSAYGPWRLSASPVLASALRVRHFAVLGPPSLVESEPTT